MRIELISTGDELLTGDITDTNASWVAQQLTEHGYKLSVKTTVSDNIDELVEAFTQRSKKADFIIVNGGLGPTSDDLSAAAAAQALGETVVLFDAWLEQMKIKFSAMGRHMHDSNIKQAMLPQSAQIVDNPVGTACGFSIVLNEATLIFTPGVPREFKQMVMEQVLPRLKQVSKVPALAIKRYLCLGIGESALAELLEGITLPQGCEFGYRAAMPFIELKVFAKNGQLPTLQLDLLEILIADYCVVYDGNSLSRHVHQLLLDRSRLGFKFGTVESCTGGMVASSLVAYAGSSAYLDRGIVTYSNEAKMQLVNVSSQALDDVGAVSIAVAEQMAQGAIAQHGLDLAVSITGIAGPEGGSAHKPVGTVAFALAIKDQCISQILLLPNRGRNQVRETACAIALDMVRRYLESDEIIGCYQSYQAIVSL